MSMRKTTLAPGQLLSSVHIEKSYHGKAGYPGQRKTHVNSHRRQTVHRGKVDPGVSELPQGNELSRVHVNRPLLTFSEFQLRPRLISNQRASVVFFL